MFSTINKIFSRRKGAVGIFFLPALIGVPLSLTGCSEESPRNEITPKETVAVNLFLSSEMPYESRAVDPSQEGNMSNIYLISVQTTTIGKNKETEEEEELTLDVPVVKMTGLNIPGGVSNTQVGSSTYDEYKLEMPPGKYRFYVVANVSRYIPKYTSTDVTIKEEDIKKIVLNFNDTYSQAAGLETQHLPMLCDAREIRFGSRNNPTPVSQANNYVVDIGSLTENHIFADLRFVCSKVRYTIIYDNEEGGVSEGFGTESIRFFVDQNSRPYATKIRQQTKLYADGNPSIDNYDPRNPFLTTSMTDGEGNTTTTNNQWTLTLGRYRLPEAWQGKKDINFTREALDNLQSWSGDDVDNTNWKKSRQRVWQGVIYLPENDETDIERTELTFPYILGWYRKDGSLGEGEGDNAETGTITVKLFDQTGHSHGLQRGYFYDVIARVIKRYDINFDISVNVYVRPWDYYHREGAW